MSWNEWEDYHAGLYKPDRNRDLERQAADLLRDADQFREAAIEMLREWPNSAQHNLDHMWSGRNAWLGQATACYVYGATAADTRAAWGTLTNTEQRAANEIARLVRERWERERKDAQTVLGI